MLQGDRRDLQFRRSLFIFEGRRLDAQHVLHRPASDTLYGCGFSQLIKSSSYDNDPLYRTTVASSWSTTFLAI